MSLVATIIQTRFTCTSHPQAVKTIQQECARSIALANAVSPQQAAQAVTVPAMLGVDEDMRAWSLLQILEHNTIVNRVVTQRIEHLLLNTEFVSDFNPKTDVMPSECPGTEQIEHFESSVTDHLATLEKYAHQNLRRTEKALHPIFGMLNAHQWNNMFGFHLMLHRKQMTAITRHLKK